jgi:hypothetical protein
VGLVVFSGTGLGVGETPNPKLKFQAPDKEENGRRGKNVKPDRFDRLKFLLSSFSRCLGFGA